MKWSNIVLGVGILCIAMGLSVGLVFPRNMITDLPFNYFVLFYILIGATVGIAFIADGLKR